MTNHIFNLKPKQICSIGRKMSLLSHLIFSLIPLLSISGTKFDYYWRDFDGEIPADAIPGGTDSSGNRTYIAQLLVQNFGLFPTRLYQGKKSVTVSRFGIHTSQIGIKILCSDKPEKFSWENVTATNFRNETKGKHLVLGGYEDCKKLNIGRATYEKEVIVGKVCGYVIGYALMYFPYNYYEKCVESYQVLVYNDGDGDNEPPSQ